MSKIYHLCQFMGFWYASHVRKLTVKINAFSGLASNWLTWFSIEGESSKAQARQRIRICLPEPKLLAYATSSKI